jgi:hypothetical protein
VLSNEKKNLDTCCEQAGRRGKDYGTKRVLINILIVSYKVDKSTADFKVRWLSKMSF